MKMQQIRDTIDTLNWARREFTGGTAEENRRTRLDERLAPHIAAVRALQIPARFTLDIQSQTEAIAYALGAIHRWRSNQIQTPKPLLTIE